MKILIVDDITDNRTTIELLLEEFDDMQTSQANSGQEAIDICKNEHFDIIFMDIMMPNIDGITATKVIKSFDSKVMILAISALDDEESKNKMLESGAEDYMTKPIEDELFYQRVKNYIQIVQARKIKLSNLDAVNEFTQEVYSRSLKFNITSMQSLSQFWDYYLNEASYSIENLEECIRMIYAYGQLSLKKEVNFSIVSEENEDNLFLTLSPLNIINELVIQRTLLKNYSNAIFILNNQNLSFRLPKGKIVEDSNLDKREITSYEQDILSKTHFDKMTAIQYVDNTAISLMDKIEELESIEDIIQSAAISFESEATQESLIKMTEGLDTYVDVIDQLMSFEHFAFGLNTLNEYLKILDLESVEEKDHRKFSTLFMHLIDDIAQWRNIIFILKDANDVHYLDSSLLSSCLQLQSIFDKKEVVQDDEDDFELF
ncbi:response regulator [Sulfurimonas sp.]|uniref:response regulator n=1 Tax=Sulfurimonas sp. TaxID=2022749 RepID=UPI0025F11972|nr:response regulator [Sulfurimonas sp.]